MNKSEGLKDNRRGRKPPYLWIIEQSPEGATDSWHHTVCHPFGVRYYYHLYRGLHPCLCSVVPIGDFGDTFDETIYRTRSKSRSLDFGAELHQIVVAIYATDYKTAF